MLDYKLIEALAAVVREGGFERAARRLHLTQSAVSQRIKLLEEQSGQILLIRSTPPGATPPGRQMIKHYLQVKRLEDDLFDGMADTGREGFVSLAVGINEDSLATWFLEAVRPFLERERVVLDLRADDQDQTHRLLKNGEVIGCISALDRPVQGCRTVYLGRMDYRLVAAPVFAARWFPEGLTRQAVQKAPLLVFNRKDKLQHRLLESALKTVPADIPVHYLPSSEKFADFIRSGIAYGVLPTEQGAGLLASGRLVDLAPACMVSVELYWHCWNLKSRLLERLTRALVDGARTALSV
jgi:LysR family transcriptional regulator, chromosome initiation inhibitor